MFLSYHPKAFLRDCNLGFIVRSHAREAKKLQLSIEVSRLNNDTVTDRPQEFRYDSIYVRTNLLPNSDIIEAFVLFKRIRKGGIRFRHINYPAGVTDYFLCELFDIILHTEQAITTQCVAFLPAIGQFRL